MTNINIHNIINDRIIECSVNGVFRSLSNTEWLKYIHDLKDADLVITIDNKLYINKFLLGRVIIAHLLATDDSLDMIEIPARKVCPTEILYWIDRYLENSKEVSYEEHYLNGIRSLAEIKPRHLYKGYLYNGTSKRR